MFLGSNRSVPIWLLFCLGLSLHCSTRLMALFLNLTQILLMIYAFPSVGWLLYTWLNSSTQSKSSTEEPRETKRMSSSSQKSPG
uniref:Uncharacterized protein n=1 Tax=Arundo donax TaxID=35708 RepID=A0A0A9AHR5_ARUDO